jgi:hypothetical protein
MTAIRQDTFAANGIEEILVARSQRPTMTPRTTRVVSPRGVRSTPTVLLRRTRQFFRTLVRDPRVARILDEVIALREQRPGERGREAFDCSRLMQSATSLSHRRVVTRSHRASPICRLNMLDEVIAPREQRPGERGREAFDRLRLMQSATSPSHRRSSYTISSRQTICRAQLTARLRTLMAAAFHGGQISAWPSRPGRVSPLPTSLACCARARAETASGRFSLRGERRAPRDAHERNLLRSHTSPLTSGSSCFA